MKPLFIVLIFGICLTFISCHSKYNTPLEEALQVADKNKGELIKVLSHYSQAKDSLKFNAAKFLILNMPIHKGYQRNSISAYTNIFSIIDTLSYRQERVTNEDKIHIGDSVAQIVGFPEIKNAKTIEDSKLISAGYLINNIDFAFEAWKKAPWSKDVNFQDFCEYILPYRIRDEELQYWRPQLLTEYAQMAHQAPNGKSIKSVFDFMNWNLNTQTNFTVFFNSYFPFSQSISDVINGKIGGCETTTFYSATVMRSIGLPVAVDFIPHWGSTNNGHYMVNAIDRSSKTELITNENIQRNTWSIVDFSSEYLKERHHFSVRDMPPGMYVQHVKTIPKIYRYTYSKNEELAELNKNVPKEYIAPEFRRTNFRDITNSFLKTGIFSFKVSKEFLKYQVAYLCVFDINGWKPVAIQKMNNGMVIFNQFGHNVVYLPAVFDNGKIIPIHPPFYSDTLNIITQLSGEGKAKQSIRLARKYPLHSYTAYHTETLKGGRFEGANKIDFSDADTLFKINYFPFYMNEVMIGNPKKFRYLRYVAPERGSWEADNIAEVQFYGYGEDEQLIGKTLGKPGLPGHEIDKAFDNDMNTYYQNAQSKDGWIGIDLGQSNAKKVLKIKFCPRNDTNCIMPGTEYELYYWRNRWVSLGIKTAINYHIDYQNIPKDGLFWLRSKNTGVEERIFSIENGMQRWW
ncbi:discoidin domain-containing protein [Pedobacter miscanthi]|uniref:Peptide-N(4)-(N-acetyl-beta-glucosaminyl)asparagine amidase n=1 Tax=Pedobacter miscanthi TaxID=2259170 RepID=A0A366KNE7_9SPHI|nr:discoidin domain-containing protein [Pedobacter miscanthi]RBQ02709.1 hypothetical protein DRW42_25530 [Pedobacter miscanthi]